MKRYALIFLAWSLVGCSDPLPPTPSSTPTPSASETTTDKTEQRKEAARALTELAQAIESKNAAQAKKLLADGSEIKQVMAGHDLTPAGVAKLEKTAVFGRLEDMFPTRSRTLLAKTKIPLDQCWAFSASPAEAWLYHDGNSYRVIRWQGIDQL